MTRSELIDGLAEDNRHLTLSDVERIVAAFFDEMTTALARGQRVELRGFGNFTVKHRKARIRRNPGPGRRWRRAENCAVLPGRWSGATEHTLTQAFIQAISTYLDSLRFGQTQQSSLRRRRVVPA